MVGYSTSLIGEATEARAEAERIAAAMAERARLARAVHDGVLQVLTLVQRRGTELGGEAAELGRLAGEQESALRALVQGNAAATAATASGRADLVEALNRLQSRTVTVSAPAHAVLLAAAAVDELVAVVRACLDNVRTHVGTDAPAWVLVEELGDRVVVTVRDEGPGIAAGRLEEARAEGRLGVAGSIRGRMARPGRRRRGSRPRRGRAPSGSWSSRSSQAREPSWTRATASSLVSRLGSSLTRPAWSSLVSAVAGTHSKKLSRSSIETSSKPEGGVEHRGALVAPLHAQPDGQAVALGVREQVPEDPGADAAVAEAAASG